MPTLTHPVSPHSLILGRSQVHARIVGCARSSGALRPSRIPPPRSDTLVVNLQHRGQACVTYALMSAAYSSNSVNSPLAHTRRAQIRTQPWFEMTQAIFLAPQYASHEHQ